MAGIAIILDLLKKKQALSTAQSLHSFTLLSSVAAASAAAATISAGKPFASRYIFGDGLIPVAHCDAGATFDGSYIPYIRDASETLLDRESIAYTPKEYTIELKPLFSAFGLKSLAITSVRSFLLFYLPLLEPRPPVEDDEDFLQEQEENHVDLVIPFKNSIKQIFRETAVVTTRRLFERIAVHYVSQRMAWKLLKDASKSAKRKSLRGIPTTSFIFCVSRTTFRGNLLGVAASWLVQVIIETYRCLFRKSAIPDENDADRAKKIRLLGKKIYSTTIKCGASLVFASIGAGIGATFYPSMGQWIGAALGDFVGPIIVIIVFEKLHLEL